MVPNSTQPHKIEVSWDDALSGNFPQTPARQLFVATVLDIAAQAAAKLPEANGRVAKARDLLLGGAVSRHEDGGFIVKSQTSRGKDYLVKDGVCNCPDAEKEHQCKHLISTWLWRKARKAVEQQLASEENGHQGAAQPTETPQGVPPQHVVLIQGKPFVKFAGLLQMAHERGLATLTADWTYNDAELSLAHAVAVFQDGRRFEESGDASPANTNRKVSLHFRRVALTRSKARCLRDALGVELVAVEELADGE